MNDKSEEEMNTLYNFRWNIDNKYETPICVFDINIHGDSKNNIIQDSLDFVENALGINRREQYKLKNHSVKRNLYFEKGNSYDFVIANGNNIYGILEQNDYIRLSEHLRYNNEGCIIEKQSRQCYNMDSSQYINAINDNIEKILDCFNPSVYNSISEFTKEFIKFNRIPLLSDSYSHTIKDFQNFFKTPIDSKDVDYLMITASGNLANKIGYFSNINEKENTSLSKTVNITDYNKNKPYLINFYGGAGIGKSTTAMLVTAELKKLHFDSDYIAETAKQHIYNGDLSLFDGTVESQTKLFTEQKKQIDSVYNSVWLAVTDSPLLLYGVYAKNGDKSKIEDLHEAISEEYHTYNNINILLTRDLSIPFEQEGRVHNLEESIAIDKEVKDALLNNGVKFTIKDRGDINGICRYILSQLELTRKYSKNKDFYEK